MDTARCFFCAKADAEVARQIAGPASYICAECVGRCDLPWLARTLRRFGGAKVDDDAVLEAAPGSMPPAGGSR